MCTEATFISQSRRTSELDTEKLDTEDFDQLRPKSKDS